MNSKTKKNRSIAADDFEQSEKQALIARVSELEARLEAREQHRQLQSFLLRLGELTWSTEDVNSLYGEIHTLIAEQVYAENFFIAVYENNRRNVRIAYFKDILDQEDEVNRALPTEEFLPTLTGFVLRTGQPLLASGAQILEMQNADILRMRGPLMESWLGVPFRYQNQVLGAIVVQSYDPQHIYTQSDLELVTFVSQQIALAIVRKRQEQALNDSKNNLEKAVEQRTAELRKTNHVLEDEINEREKAERLQVVLYRIAKLTNAEIDLDGFFSDVHSAICELMCALNFFIALLDEQNIIHFRYVTDPNIDDYASRPYDPEGTNKGFTEIVLSSGNAFLFNAKQQNSESYSDAYYGKSASSWLGVPLKRGEKTIGVLVVQSYNGEVVYDEADKALLTFVAQHISTALRRREDADSLQQAHSKLTQVNDRLEERIEERTLALTKANQQLQKTLEERKLIELRLSHAASHDSLTGLPNRSLLRDRLDNTIKRGLRREQITYALLFFDLDRFKVINDSLGHVVGDSLLKQVAERLLACVRPGDTVARLGGDEFCVLLEDIKTNEAPIRVAKRVLEILKDVIQVDGHKIFVSTSIGIALGDVSYQTADAMLRDADTAMYQAKNNGKGRYAVFSPDMHEHAVTRLQHEGGLRQAVEKDLIYLDYQPVVDLATREIISIEALARWKHPEFGFVSPDEFISLAEETGLIMDLGMQVLRKSVREIKRWRVQHPHLTINVNLSPLQFSQHRLVDNIFELLGEESLPAEALNLEITENLFLYHFENVDKSLEKFSEAGIGIVLDDFGKGYSSLSYLRDIPLICLKIDRGFTREITTNRENRCIISAVNQLAKDLDIRVVAEGVETKEHVEVLQQLGISLGQGYYFARPGPVKTFL